MPRDVYFFQYPINGYAGSYREYIKRTYYILPREYYITRVWYGGLVLRKRFERPQSVGVMTDNFFTN